MFRVFKYCKPEPQRPAPSAQRLHSLSNPFLVGALLLIASALKVYELLTAPTAEVSFWTSRLFLIVLYFPRFSKRRTVIAESSALSRRSRQEAVLVHGKQPSQCCPLVSTPSVNHCSCG